MSVKILRFIGDQAESDLTKFRQAGVKPSLALYILHINMLNWLTQLSVADQLYLLLLLLTTLIVAARYRNLPINLRPLLWLSAAHLIAELSTDYLHFVLRKNNMYVYHLLTLVEYVFISILFYRTFATILLRRYVLWSIVFFIALVGVYSIRWEPLTENNPYSFITESVLVIIWCYLFFRETLLRQPEYRPEKDRTFWIVIALLFYFTGEFFILGGINYFDKTNPELARKIYYAGYAFKYLLYFMISLVCLIRFPDVAHD